MQLIQKIDVIYLEKYELLSRNLGIRRSNSKYIAFIDADDLWGSEKLKNQINFMEKNKLHFTYTDYTPFIEINKKIFKEK